MWGYMTPENWTKKTFRDITFKGMPLLFNEFFWSLGTATIMQCYSVRGLEVVAASNIATTAANLFNVIFISMGNAIVLRDNNNNMMLSKKRYEAKIDNVSALMDAFVAYKINKEAFG